MQANEQLNVRQTEKKEFSKKDAFWQRYSVDKIWQETYLTASAPVHSQWSFDGFGPQFSFTSPLNGENFPRLNSSLRCYVPNFSCWLSRAENCRLCFTWLRVLKLIFGFLRLMLTELLNKRLFFAPPLSEFYLIHDLSDLLSRAKPSTMKIVYHSFYNLIIHSIISRIYPHNVEGIIIITT
jgi:hypothetical protein